MDVWTRVEFLIDRHLASIGKINVRDRVMRIQRALEYTLTTFFGQEQSTATGEYLCFTHIYIFIPVLQLPGPWWVPVTRPFTRGRLTSSRVS